MVKYKEVKSFIENNKRTLQWLGLEIDQKIFEEFC